MKNINRRIYEIAGVICMLALFSCFLGMTVCAAESVEGASQALVVSSRTSDDGIYVYIKGAGDITEGTTVQVGTTLCEDIKTTEVVSMGMPIRTMILLDNSLSVSNRWGDQARELIDALIENHAEGEEFKIVTFADGLNVVADFSTDYESLKASVNEIEFYNQDSYLTDILYDLLKQDGDGSEANYTRLIIITDGADDNEIKYTQAELLELMRSCGVVIHAVGVKTSNNNRLLETLFSYSRSTGGVYTTVDGGVDVEGVRSMLDEDYFLFCLRLVPEANMMDGSRKEAKLSLNTPNGMIVLTTSLQMPFAEVDHIQKEEEEEMISPPAVVTENPGMPSIAVKPQAENEAEKKEKGAIVPVVVAGVAAAGAIILISILLVLKGKKRGQSNAADEKDAQVGAQSNQLQISRSQKEDLMESDKRLTDVRMQPDDDIGEKTVPLRSDHSQSIVRRSFITITDIGDCYRSFRVPIDTKIVIGRKTGDILLRHDAAVSHAHCEIIKKGDLFYVKDLKSSNGTFYGNMRVYIDTPIMSGGILTVGAGKYRITIED